MRYGEEATPAEEATQDFSKARERMVREQLASRGVRDPRVLEAMGRIPRHLFVEPASADQAYDDGPLPLIERQTISQPYMVALMTEALELTGTERVLEVGTGSGYQTAVLAQLCRWVYSIEKISALAFQAKSVLDRLGCRTITIRVGDGTLGWPEEAPFDAVLVTAGSPALPGPLVAQLGPGGRLVIPLGSEDLQVLARVRRTDSGLKEERLSECRFVKLVGKHGWPD